MMASGGRGNGENEKRGSSSLFFHFRQCEETARKQNISQNFNFAANAKGGCVLFETVASSQKQFQRERFIPLDARKRPRTYGKCYDSAATRSGLFKHVMRFSYPSPDRTQSIKKVVLVLTKSNFINAKRRTNRCGRIVCDTWIRAPFSFWNENCENPMSITKQNHFHFEKEKFHVTK